MFPVGKRWSGLSQRISDGADSWKVPSDSTLTARAKKSFIRGNSGGWISVFITMYPNKLLKFNQYPFPKYDPCSDFSILGILSTILKLETYPSYYQSPATYVYISIKCRHFYFQLICLILPTCLRHCHHPNLTHIHVSFGQSL